MSDLDSRQDVALFDDNGVALQLHTPTTGNKILQVVSKSDEHQDIEDGLAFIATTPNLTISGLTEVPYMLIRNPNASGKNVDLEEMYFSMVAGISGSGAQFKLYRDATVTTNGTTVAINKRVKNQANSAVALVTTAPTVSANGTLIESFSIYGGMNTFIREMGEVIQPNENLYITITQMVTGKIYTTTLEWVEE
jgi:hypothetical protein